MKSQNNSQKVHDIPDTELIIKRYKVRATGNAKSTIETSIPKEVFEREARRLGFTPEEALEKALAVWRYDNFPGIYLTFELRETRY